MFKTVTDTTSILGECPVWCERTHCLFWTDIPGCELRALDPISDDVRRWPLPEPLGSFALTADKNVLLLGLASCLGYFNLTTGRFSKIVVTPGVAGTRINDGRCDRMGNFVFSTMFAGERVQAVGRFHRLNAMTLETETLDLPEVAIPNSICFSPDGSTMYYADSCRDAFSAVIIPRWKISACLRKLPVRALRMVPALMQRGFYGMPNGAAEGSCAMGLTARLTMYCRLPPFRPRVRCWLVRAMTRSIAQAHEQDWKS